MKVAINVSTSASYSADKLVTACEELADSSEPKAKKFMSALAAWLTAPSGADLPQLKGISKSPLGRLCEIALEETEEEEINSTSLRRLKKSGIL